MRIFVTGGTGLLGNTILRQLTEAGHESVALVRGEPAAEVFDGIDTEFAIGDICDVDVIDAAIARCDAVIHSAGLIHIGWKRLEESMHVNHQGTRVLVDACIKYDRKLVHVGTVDALGPGSIDGPGDEETPMDNAGGQTPCNYVVSKLAGVDEVNEGVQRGLRAVIVHPGFMLGPWDWKPSSGRMMLEVGKAWRPLAPSGGCSVCDPRDVAAGTIAALHRGGDQGRAFVLAGENWDYKKIWSEMAVRMGRRPPLARVPMFLGLLVGWGGDLWAMITRNEGDINSAGIKMSAIYHWHDSSRAIRELGYTTRDPYESLDASAEWIKKHHQ